MSDPSDILSLLDRFKALWSDLDKQLSEWKKEAVELRELPGPVSVDESVMALRDRLVTTRQAQDRLEAIVANLGLFRSRCKKLVAELDEAYEDAWREAMLSSRVGEYTSAKERDATYAAGSVEELLRLRRAKRWLDDISEVHEFCLIKFRGLDSARRDTETRIRLVNVESFLER